MNRREIPELRDQFNRKLPPLGARNSIDAIFADAPHMKSVALGMAAFIDNLGESSGDVAWLDRIDSRKLSQAVADMRAENERNASLADVAAHPIGDSQNG